MSRPTLAYIHSKFINEVKGISIKLEKTKNKGLPGQKLEKLLGIPTSLSCLDCCDGELKIFPMKKLKSGEFVPKESIAITMSGLCAKSLSECIPWEMSALNKKTSNMLFVSYYRDNETITFMDCYTFGSLSKEFEAFENDYNILMEHFRKNGVRSRGNTVNGKYIQCRTKGTGGIKKTVAFYFRNKEFVKDVILGRRELPL